MQRARSRAKVLTVARRTVKIPACRTRTAIYTIAELADLAGVTPRTIRYYLAQGLAALPPASPVRAPATRQSHLARLRVIRRLQAEHQPLAEIRTPLGDPGRRRDPRAGRTGRAGAASRTPRSTTSRPSSAGRSPVGGPPISYARPAPVLARRAMVGATGDDCGPCSRPPRPSSASASPITRRPTPGDRSQWERIVLATDVELHIRRPSSRTQNKRVDRLVTIARELFQEDPS